MNILSYEGIWGIKTIRNKKKLNKFFIPKIFLDANIALILTNCPQNCPKMAQNASKMTQMGLFGDIALLMGPS